MKNKIPVLKHRDSQWVKAKQEA